MTGRLSQVNAEHNNRPRRCKQRSGGGGLSLLDFPEPCQQRQIEAAGMYKPISLTTLLRIARALNVPAYKFLDF